MYAWIPPVRQGQGRLYIGLEDKAYGRMGVIVKFGEIESGDDVYTNFSDYTLLENHQLRLNNDYRVDDGEIKVVIYDEDSYTESPTTVEGYVLYSHGAINYGTASNPMGCGGSIATTSIILTTLAFVSVIGVSFSLIRRKKQLGGK